MSHFLKLLFSLSLSGGLLTLLLLALRPLYQNRLSHRWQYYIWLAAALRFLLPIAPEQSMLNRLLAEPAAPSPYPGNMPTGDLILPGNIPENLTAAPAALPAANEASASLWPDCLPWLLLIWAGAALLLLCRQITQYQSFGRYLQAACQPVEDMALLEQLAACAESLGLRQPVELQKCALLQTPAVFGLRRPRIILPAEQMAALAPEQLELIFRHELTHLRRHDLWYKWLAQLALCLHWFNPLAHLLSREINRCCELACDEAVLQALAGPKQRRLYGDTLLAFCQTANIYKNSLAAITLTEGAAQLKERLGAIMNFQPKTKGQKLAALLLAAAVCFCFFLLGAYAAPIFPDKSTVTDADLDKRLANSPVFRQTLDNNDKVDDDALIKDKILIMGEGGGANANKPKGTFAFTQTCFYSEGYIIELGWNLPKDYEGQGEVLRMLTLEEGQAAVPVCFAQAAQAYAEDPAAMQALRELLLQMRRNEQAKGKTNSEIQRPYVQRMLPAPAEKVPQLAAELYRQQDLSPFAALFPQLDAAAKAAYWQRIYADNLINFWSCTAEYMTQEQLLYFIGRTDDDDRIDFFSVILNYLRAEDLFSLAQKYYDRNDIARFSILTSYMTKEQQEQWLAKARADRKNSFATMLGDGLKYDGWQEYWDDFADYWDDFYDYWDDFYYQLDNYEDQKYNLEEHQRNMEEYQRNMEEYQRNMEELRSNYAEILGAILRPGSQP